MPLGKTYPLLSLSSIQREIQSVIKIIIHTVACSSCHECIRAYSRFASLYEAKKKFGRSQMAAEMLGRYQEQSFVNREPTHTLIDYRETLYLMKFCYIEDAYIRRDSINFGTELLHEKL